IDGSARRNVRKAEAAGITITVDNAAFAFLEACHVENMRVIGGKAKPHQFFELVPRCLREDSDFALYVARHRGNLVAALLVLFHAQTAEYFVPVVAEEHRSSQALPLIIYEAARDAVTRGMRRWNWGGTWTSQEGVYRFKRKWGAIDRPYR